MNIFRRERDVKSFTTGQSIFSEGEVGDVMYAVVEGTVDIVWRGQLPVHPEVVGSFSVPEERVIVVFDEHAQT